MKHPKRYGQDAFFTVVFAAGFIAVAWLLGNVAISDRARHDARVQACATAPCGPGKRGVLAYSRDRNAEVCFCDPVLAMP